jgi:hypothetical protein
VEHLAPDGAGSVLRHLCQLYAISVTPGAAPAEQSREAVRAAKLAQVQRNIEQHLADKALSPVQAAAATTPSCATCACPRSLCARVAFVTGDTLGAAASGFLAHAGRPILEKPFVPAELRRLMAELVR